MEKCIGAALALSANSELQSRHGCVIANGKKIIAAQTNTKSTRVLGENVPSVHAERAALAVLSRSLRKKNLNMYRSLRVPRKTWCEKARYLCS
jgi:deoxycytidylate deaminase